MSTQDTAALIESVNNMTDTVAGKMGEIDAKLLSAEQAFNLWKANFSENINGLEVYKQGGMRRFFFGQYLSSGGWTGDGNGPDADFVACSNPQPPYYVNLLEFVSSYGFGGYGDIFRIEFIMSHRGMGSSDGYIDHLVFTGTSWNDSVSGSLEVRKVSHDGAVSVFVSEPNNEEREVALTNSLEGSVIPISFRSIGQGYDSGSARVTLKIDSRYFCGAERAFGADVTYTSNCGRPAAARVSQTKPRWDD